MTMTISLNREESIRLADSLRIDRELIKGGGITSLTIYGDLRDDREDKNDAE